MAKGGQTSDLTIFIEKERFPLIFFPPTLNIINIHYLTFFSF